MEINRVRYELSERFLGYLEDAYNTGWQELCHSYVIGELTFPGSMVLIHPKLVETYLQSFAHSIPIDTEEFQVNIQGEQRVFSKSPLKKTTNCGALQCWGVSCALTLTPIESDHDFPWSFGGPTIRENLLYLCQTHNRLKGNDIHLFPWEKGAPAWLEQQIFKTRNYLHQASKR